MNYFLTMILVVNANDRQISVIAQNFVLVTASASAPSFQALLLLRLDCMYA